MDYEKNAIEILRMIGSNSGFTVADYSERTDYRADT